jgi:hypothetical protein
LKIFNLKIVLTATIQILHFSIDPVDIGGLWSLISDILNQKLVSEQWHQVESDLIEILRILYLCNIEAVFSLYFGVLEKTFLKPAKLKLWLYLGKAFVSNDITASQRFLARFCSRIENLHGADLKIATCQTFAYLGNSLSQTFGKNSPSTELSHFIESKVSSIINQYLQKAKYHHVAYISLSSMTVLCSKTFFLSHFQSLILVIQNLIQSRIISSEDGLLSILQLFWTYLNRHTEAWATMGRNIEALIDTVFLGDLKKSNRQLMVEIMTVIFFKMPKIALNAIILQKLEDFRNDWDKCLILIGSLRNFLSFHREGAMRPNSYPTKPGLFFIDANDCFKGDFHADLLGPFDSRDFFDKFQNQLVIILISIVDSTWHDSIVDPKENTSFRLDGVQNNLILLMLLFDPLPNEGNLQNLGDAITKLLLVEKLEFEMERYLSQVHKYPIIWLEILVHSLDFLFNMSEILIEKRHRLFKFIKLLLNNRERIDKDIKLPLGLLERTSSILSVSSIFIELYPINSEYLGSKDFENLLYKNLSKLFYFCTAAKGLNKDILNILRGYFTFLISKHGDNPKLKRLKRSSWSFESLSRFSFDSNKYNLGELYSMLCQSLEHENFELREMAIRVLMEIPLGQISIMLDSLFELQEACSESLRNVKYRPLKSSQKADELKVHFTKLQAHLIDRLMKEENAKLDDKFIQVVQRHLLEVFYFECEIDINISIPELRLSFYGLIKSLFNLDRFFKRKFSLFPYKLQSELFSYMNQWYVNIQLEKRESEIFSRMNQRLETELISVMFLLCDGLLSPPPSHRYDMISVQTVLKWIDEIGVLEKYHERAQKALSDLLQNGAIIDHIIDRCYKYWKQGPVYSKCLENYYQREKKNLSEELKARLDIVLLSTIK